MKKWGTLLCLFVLMTVITVGISEGAGTLRLTFKYKNSAGVETPLDNAYVYLRARASGAPVEKFFSPASLILGPTDISGRLIANGVPEGDYYIRVTRRSTIGTTQRPLGPPENGDYTWNQAKLITISTNTVTDLGTKYAWFFGSAPITISGTVKNWSGTPLAGRLVRLQDGPCIEGNYAGTDESQWVYQNYCSGGSANKKMAALRTDANGNYTIFLREPGTFWIYETTCLGCTGSEYTGNPYIRYGTGPVTVNMGDHITVNITGN